MPKIDTINYKGTSYDFKDKYALTRSQLKEAMTYYNGWSSTRWDIIEDSSFREYIVLANGMVLFGGHYIGESGGGSEITVGIDLYNIFFGCMPIVRDRTTNATSVPCISDVDYRTDSTMPPGTWRYKFTLGISENSKCTVVGIGRTFTRNEASISAGTYTAERFRSLVESFMSAGSKRYLETPVNVTVNGQTFNATCVGLKEINSGGQNFSSAYCIYFGEEPNVSSPGPLGDYLFDFNEHGIYLVPEWGGYYTSCRDYEITIQDDLIFA